MLNPAWALCEMCEDYFCHIHNQHTGDCDCPMIEDWQEEGFCPYFDNISYEMVAWVDANGYEASCEKELQEFEKD